MRARVSSSTTSSESRSNSKALLVRALSISPVPPAANTRERSRRERARSVNQLQIRGGRNKSRNSIRGAAITGRISGRRHHAGRSMLRRSLPQTCAGGDGACASPVKVALPSTVSCCCAGNPAAFRRLLKIFECSGPIGARLRAEADQNCRESSCFTVSLCGCVGDQGGTALGIGRNSVARKQFLAQRRVRGGFQSLGSRFHMSKLHSLRDWATSVAGGTRSG